VDRGPARRGPTLRRIAFIVLSGLLGVVTALGLFGLPLLIVAWFDKEDGGIHRFHYLAWGALIGVLAAGPALLQLRKPERKVAATQQIGVVLFAIVLGYALSGEFSLIGFVVLLAAYTGFALLHPNRGAILRVGAPSPILVGIALAAAVLFFVYAVGQGSLQQSAVPGDLHAEKDHYLDMARVASAVPLVGLLASLRTSGSRIPAWCAGIACSFLGAASLIFPKQSSSFGSSWGAVALLGGFVFVAVHEWETRLRERQQASDPGRVSGAP
jgi:hypothetical protein